jgi:exodeoxyribonuclease VII large subunit
MSSFGTLLTGKKIYSVSELNRETKDLLSCHFSLIQIEGEISNLSQPASGHIYFSLKDKKAQVRCAMFKSQLRRLNFIPKNGTQVIVSAQVSLYEARGDYQLIADKIQQAGEGDLQLAFEQLKSKLNNEGLFDQNIKQTPPALPNHIGVITSPSGAAVHDILSVLKRRFPSIPVLIYPTAVQGESAKFEIAHAIETANQHGQVDVILLARGGGSLEDLWSFNEENVARAIVKSKIPIISGIGHEVDFTIADFVADLRAPTPSAAAETAVPNQQAWLSAFQTIDLQLQQIIQRQLSQYRQSTQWLSKRLQQQHPEQQYQRHAQTLDHIEARLLRAIQSKIRHDKSLIANQNNVLQLHNPANRIIRYQEQLQYLNNRLNRAVHTKLEKLKRKHLYIIQTLNAISPLATLERGYSITSLVDSSSIISSSNRLSIDDKIKTRFAHGYVVSQVKEITHE